MPQLGSRPWLLSITVLLLPSAHAPAATKCFEESCSATCTPDPPVAISTLVPESEFPVGMRTPMVFADPGDHRGNRLIATRQGAILLWDGTTRSIRPTPFLDLRDDVGGPVLGGGGRGLMGMVLEPDYAESGRLYVFYTRVDSGKGTIGDNVIERYERSAEDPDLGDPATATTILVIEHSDEQNHNGGAMAFGPDGFLYIATGDGGGQCDNGAGVSGDGQSTTSLGGKILRIDVLGIDPEGIPPDDCSVEAGPYTIPSDNPLAKQEPACDEIYALGLRNPFRFTIDRETGDLYIADVGQDKWEEINVLATTTPGPANFGWVCREGCESSNNGESQCATTGCPFDTGTTCQFPRLGSGFWDPALCHHNGDWGAIISGYRYRGTRIPSISGDYLYTDVICGQIWKTTELDPADPASIDAECWASGYQGTYAFAEDRGGELYLINGQDSRIDCIHNGEGCFWTEPEIFANGFEEGDTSAWE